MRFFQYTLFLCLINSGLIFSQENVYVLDTLYPVHSLDHVLKVYPDINAVFTPKKIVADTTLSFLQGDELPRYLEVGTTYWGKLSLKTKEPLIGWTLHFEDKMIGPPAWTKSNGTVDVYGYVDKEFIFHQKTGVEYPKKEKTYKGNWIMNAITLDSLPVNKVVEVIIKVKGNAMGYPAYFNLTARSPDQPYYHQFNQYHSSFNIFLFGVTFIILLYHFLQYIYLREPIFLWFCIWLVFCTLTQAMTVGFIIGGLAKFRYITWLLIANGIFYSFWFFGRAFIDSKIKFPILDRVMLGLALFILVEILLTTVYVLLLEPQTSFTGVGFHYVFLNVYAVASLIVSIVIALKNDAFARYFGIGSIVASIALVIGTLWSMDLMNPPFRLDPYATGIFLQIIIYSFGIAYRRQTIAKRNENERVEAEKSRSEILRMKDLDELKTRFFTNISHEFRTPLTLIQGPLENAKRVQKDNGVQGVTLSETEFNIVQRNSSRLQSLVDELLELSKLESGKTILSLTKNDIIPFLKLMVYSFESTAERAGIFYEVTFSSDSEIGYFDADRLEKIVNNLLSNAFKYTSQGGKVTVNVDFNNGNLDFSVSDTGNGISKEDIGNVFDRFYRVEGSERNGSGIGLALTKELVELHQGEIKVESSLGKGTAFYLKIPITLEGLPKSAMIVEAQAPTDTEEGYFETFTTLSEKGSNRSKRDLPIALIVEDNEDLRSYVGCILEGQYEILLAKDGEEGERIATTEIPDIIISDVMMPKKDGFALCDTLKTNSKTSHIPIILLTAKAGQDNKMQGLYQGADAYLTKPFASDELLVRIKNLIGLREKLWIKVKELDGLLVDDLSLNSMEDEFLKKVFKVINEHLEDCSFSVELLASSVGFSRAQLHRKLKALTNKSANQLISEIRLNSAFKLLQNCTGNVSEVAYSVGFSNLSYFAKSFKEKFGISPSEVAVIRN
ncbi:hybrid sensor histidine kinase/response regulator transcription factor [Maribacter aurantiacus]|uniref:histidine kinase n=1 Tax=Maribacter aurantiacus TaxID=1882343 RepID=A0A5R8M3V1_9FLAO|nr:ATP-binding protein [Maribacter aurantiacus]TLF44243.1 response regulator [Maribacter aurantiacus]